MKESDNSDDNTSKIARIAYRQSRVMCNNGDKSEESNGPRKDRFVCKNRLMNLPIIASFNSSISEAYTSVKTSNSTVEKILNHTEDGLNEGAKIVSPVALKIGETLEEPLKTIDSAICHGLDYLEEKVPSVKLPPGELYENVGEYIKTVSESVKKQSTDIYADVKVKLEELTNVVESAQTERTEKTEKDRNHEK